jgi:23S rRNA (guanosine2251-2'-O)-methyltransferase
LAALDNPRRRCLRILATAEVKKQWARRLAVPGAPEVEVLARHDIDRHMPGAVHQGLAVLASLPPVVDLADVLASIATETRATVVVLDQVQDPHNVGAILRSAAAFGAGAVVVQDRRSPAAAGAVTKAASGALEIVPLVPVVNLARALAQLKDAGFWCIALDAAATESIDRADLPARVALVFGSEGGGLRRMTQQTCDLSLRLPTGAAQPSLNVSNAVAVALYEIRRRADAASPSAVRDR